MCSLHRCDPEAGMKPLTVAGDGYHAVAERCRGCEGRGTNELPAPPPGRYESPVSMVMRVMHVRCNRCDGSGVEPFFGAIKKHPLEYTLQFASQEAAKCPS